MRPPAFPHAPTVIAKVATGPKIADPAPYPPTISPTTSPRLSGNHFDPTGVGVAYPNPFPRPITTPNARYTATSESVRLARRKPAPTRTLPIAAGMRGPLTSCNRPANTNETAKQTIAIVKTHDVCARVHPNSLSSGRTNTLQAYNDPRPRFISTPPTTGH